jgi:hypothetical protein
VYIRILNGFLTQEIQGPQTATVTGQQSIVCQGSVALVSVPFEGATPPDITDQVVVVWVVKALHGIT